MMKYGSLFTGIGGFDLALNRAGFVSAWMCEIDKNCQNILRKHFAGVKIYDDIKEIGEGTEPVDVLVGGFPCQDLSVAGKREGLTGERSGLWFEFKRVIALLRPEWVVIENVPGLLSSSGGRDFTIVLQGLDELGYGVCWRILDSQYFGVPQRRRRVFIVGHIGDGSGSQVLFEPESEIRNPKKSRKAREEITRGSDESSIGEQHRIAKGIVSKGNGEAWLSDTHTSLNSSGGGQAGQGYPAVMIANWQSGGGKMDDDVAASLRAGAEHSAQFVWEDKPNAIAIQNTLIDRDNGGPEGIGVNESGTMYTMDASGQPHAVAWHGAQITDPRNQGGVFEEQTPTLNSDSRNMVAFNTNEGNSAGVRIQINAEKSVTLQSGGGGMSAKTGMYTTPMGVRRLTPVECERLQGFPDGWTEGQVDSVRYRQLGNAVTVNVVEWIAKRIAKLY